MMTTMMGSHTSSSSLPTFPSPSRSAKIRGAAWAKERRGAEGQSGAAQHATHTSRCACVSLCLRPPSLFQPKTRPPLYFLERRLCGCAKAASAQCVRVCVYLLSPPLPTLFPLCFRNFRLFPPYLPNDLMRRCGRSPLLAGGERAATCCC